MPALIVVPASSQHAGSFMATANDLLTSQYRNDGMIFKMAFASDATWSFLPATSPPKGLSSSFDDTLKAATSFLTISHVGTTDGPIMTHDFKDPSNPGKYDWSKCQPWPTDGKGALGPAGSEFWTRIGRAPKTNKIMILGCDSGVSYSRAVADVAGIAVYGFKDECAAGNPSSMRPYVEGIEAGRVPHGIVKSERYNGPMGCAFPGP